jgi:hypothetical protein
VADVLRKLLVPALLALTSFFVPSTAVAATAPSAVVPYVGHQCLNSTYPPLYMVNVNGCNGSSGQHWTVSGGVIYLTQRPNLCLTSDYPNSYIVSTSNCNASSDRQQWTVSGETIYETQHPNVCLNSDYSRSYIVSVSGCNSGSGQQHWTVLGEQISMTFV